MKTFTRVVAVAACTAAAALTVVPAAQAAPAARAAAAGCRYYYTSYFTGPNGEKTGSGEYAEGDHDPEGRICRNGWWVSPYELEDPGTAIR
ncbi:hypothetical protein WDV06_11415 [Streptomyces racemochromogenes]|uniref:Secreted protein n=1 Tax=Streptomyces racemochromogenes TaxID=67353 RepID=A0ABW7PC10_9ACTN